ncbi:SHOCT domain-containing protein [Mycobacterium sp. 21AC1]|uniref:SHOCT domain-containing protein n=1 Tax=[Mycobacterium] appelbergii TaxID=2939269 RepID=UPI002938DB17|nr:SHOCT domain-containing protein [Mycobacterium sp. 21AC1]MDV3128027.1 SHOCT domain-containing protein [Mycobacterium sp. 21AC1]
MSSGRGAPRIAVVMSILVFTAAGIGFFVMLMLNAFVLDKFDAYGEVEIPGTGSVELPAGEVTISFHTYTTGSGGGLPVPRLGLRISAPAGVADPVVTESMGGTTTVNNDARVRVWVAHVAEEATYEIVTDGEVNGYISPRLAFGHGSAYGWTVWALGGLTAAGALMLVTSLMWSARAGKRARPLGPVAEVPTPAYGNTVAASHEPTDQGVRLEQLKTIAALRDSGALTEAEFEAEKRRILNG